MADDDATTQEQGQPDIRALRERAERASELERENAALRRRDAFRSAGIDPDDKKSAYFFNGYQGELDPDKIRAEALEAGFLSAGPTPEQQQQLDAAQRINGIAGQAQAQGAAATGDVLLARLETGYNESGSAGLMKALAEIGVPIAAGD